MSRQVSVEVVVTVVWTNILFSMLCACMVTISLLSSAELIDDDIRVTEAAGHKISVTDATRSEITMATCGDDR